MFEKNDPIESGLALIPDCRHDMRIIGSGIGLRAGHGGVTVSGSNDWNTKEIREFKRAFGKRNDLNLFSTEPKHDPAKAYGQARDMLQKRWADATGSLNAIIEKHKDFGTNSLLDGLKERFKNLSDATTYLLKQDPNDDYDGATGALLVQTDQWVEFEARCVSAENDMTTGKSDSGVRQRLASRAASLARTFEGLEEAVETQKIAVELKRLRSDIEALVNHAGQTGDTIKDPVSFGHELDRYTAALQQEISLVAKAGKTPGDIYKAEIKNLYGLDIEVSPKSKQRLGMEWSFPYERFLQALALVPPDHSMNEQLQKIVYERLEGAGADYSEFNKRIRIDPLMDWNFIGQSYKDPESGKVSRVDAFAVTTLHEIGHAVDAAYRVMETHGGKAGCGEWTEVHPVQYMLTSYVDFWQAMDESGIDAPGFTQNIKHDALKSLIVGYAVGNKNLSQARDDAETFWNAVYEHTSGQVFDTRKSEVDLAIQYLTTEVAIALPEKRSVLDFDTARDGFERQSNVAALLDQITGGLVPAFSRNDFYQKFRPVAEDPKTSVADLLQWLFDRLQEFGPAIDDARKIDKKNSVAAWTTATVKALPKPVDLKKYLAAASPWKTDLSNQTIGDLPASHEAYKGNTRWWRYSGTDRTGTYVSDYQWRAPGEWFAELYAITWFRKVEPPAGVANDVRQYLFGGHVAPTTM